MKRNASNKLLIILYFILLGCGSFYFGIAGFVNSQYALEISQIPREYYIPEKDSITGKDKIYQFQNMQYSSRGEIREVQISFKVLPVYRWLFNISQSMILIVACSFLGALGAVFKILYELIVEKGPLNYRKSLIYPLLGFLSGFIILAISYALPKFLTTAIEINLDPGSVLFISLLAGMFVEIFYAWLANIAQTFFKS